MKRPIDYFKEMKDIDLRLVYRQIEEFQKTGILSRDSWVREIRKSFTLQMKGTDTDYPLSMFIQPAYEEMARRWFENRIPAGTGDDGCIAYQKTTHIHIEEK